MATFQNTNESFGDRFTVTTEEIPSMVAHFQQLWGAEQADKWGCTVAEANERIESEFMDGLEEVAE